MLNMNLEESSDDQGCRQENDDQRPEKEQGCPDQDQPACPNSGEAPHEKISCCSCTGSCENDEALKQDSLIRAIAGVLNCDIILYAGPILQGHERAVVEWSYNGPSYAENTLLILATYGGSPDAAFKIARAIQMKAVERGGFFWIVIPDYCKSAGTLIAMGANVLLIGENGELGPVDVQLVKKDELLGRTSGLTPQQALNTMAEASMALFEKHFLSVLHNSGTRISTKLSARIATELTTGLMGQIYSQIDPMQLGEAFRSLRIATDYGNILAQLGGNLHENALDKLVNGYPSHEFVIDLREAQGLFKRAWALPDLMKKLVQFLKEKISRGLNSQTPIFEVLTKKMATEKTGDSQAKMEDVCDDTGEQAPTA